MTRYFLQETMSEGLVRVSSKYGFQLFSVRKLRKAKTCESCLKEIPKGAEAWADVTSCAMNRSHRVHAECFR